VRALNAVGHLFEPFASGLRALYAVGHFFEPRASGVRALYAFGHYFEPLASGTLVFDFQLSISNFECRYQFSTSRQEIVNEHLWESRTWIQSA